jgi:hypothetical protein
VPHLKQPQLSDLHQYLAEAIDLCESGRGLPRCVGRVREALEPIADHDADILDTAVLDLGEHPEPELRTLAAVTSLDAEDVAFLGHGDTNSDIERLVAHLPVADLRRRSRR